MAVVTILDGVTAWVREEICSQIRLKVPPADEQAATDAGYEYQLVTPAAFSLFVPTKEKLPPSVISPIPSVCVRILEGADDLSASTGSIGVQLCFSTWDPGTHGADVLKPVPGDSLRMQQWTGPEAEEYFDRNGDGWRDAWNLVDIALREIESRAFIAGYEIDRSTPVKFGPLSEQEAIPDFYPLWFAWVSFSLTYPLRRNNPSIETLL